MQDFFQQNVCSLSLVSIHSSVVTVSKINSVMQRILFASLNLALSLDHSNQSLIFQPL